MIRLAHEGEERLVSFWGSLLPLAQDPSFHDVTLICKDGEAFGNSLLLALAIPHMEQLLKEREGEQAIIMILPQFKTQEVSSAVEDFFQQQLGENVKDEDINEYDSVFDNDFDSRDYEDDLNDLDFEPKLEPKEEEDQDGEKRRTVNNTSRPKKGVKRTKNYADLPDICPICKPKRKLTVTDLKRRRHFEIHHQVSSSYLHPCHYCWEWFPTTEELDNHQMYHSGDPDHLYCNICPASFKAQMNTRLLFNKQEKDGTIILVGQNTLDSHLKTHQEKPLCKECGKEFKHLQVLRVHMQSHREKTLSCDICGRKFSHRKALENHINIKHTKNLDFACENCEKRFPTSAYLKSHQKTHSDLKPYICKGCGKGFKVKKDADRHFLAIHTDIRPLKCSYEGCTKTFAYTSIKNRHERTHSGDKSYKCDFCEKAFYRASTLNKHKKIHTGKYLNKNADFNIDCDLNL